MPLADRLAEHVNRDVGGRCLMGAVYQQLDDTDRDALDAAIAQVRAAREVGTSNRAAMGLSASAVYRALRAEGYNVSLDTVSRHVFQHCACVR